jgi:hypothetical protein
VSILRPSCWKLGLPKESPMAVEEIIGFLEKAMKEEPRDSGAQE